MYCIRLKAVNKAILNNLFASVSCQNENAPFRKLVTTISCVYCQDVIGCTSGVDFFLWPRKDLDKILCMLFSRWKGDPGPYKHILVGIHYTSLLKKQ